MADQAEPETGAAGEPTQASAPAQGGAAPRFEPIYAIFQGGGAKGITHVGALKAMEEQRLVAVGLAGTSAGAIVAALVAVGYRADDLLDPVGRESILGTHSPVDWLGRGRWRRFVAIRRLLSAWKPIAAALVAYVALLAVHALVVAGAIAWRGWIVIPLRVAIGAGTIALAALALATAILIVPPLRRRGLFTSDALRDLVNAKLRDRLRAHYEATGSPREPPELVTFADIDPVVVPQCRALKIVASDVARRRLVLFDAGTPSVVVADAVVASAGIPFAFAPPRVRGWTGSEASVFADGGLMSNLPSWVFAVEKRALERAQRRASIPIVAFTLVPERKPQPPASPPFDQPGLAPAAPRRSILAYVTDVLETGVFGGQTIVEQFVSDLEVIPLPTPLTTLAFDGGWIPAIAGYRSGYQAAEGALRRRRECRAMTDAILAAILEVAASLVAERRAAAGRPVPHLRLSLVDPSGPRDREASEFRVVASAAMDADADDRLPLDPRNGGAPQAFKDRRAVFATVAGKDAAALWMTRYEYALVRHGLCSIIAIPVFGRPLRVEDEPPPPQRVLCLDSDDDLSGEFGDPRFLARLADLAGDTSATLIRERVG